MSRDAEQVACVGVVMLFLSSGSHLLPHADWGCMDGDHRAWIIMDVADKKGGDGDRPAGAPRLARVIGLNTWLCRELCGCNHGLIAAPAG